MVLETRGKFLYFEHKEGNFEFVRIDSILSCWDTSDKQCEIKYVFDNNYFEVDVLNHSAKEVLRALCRRQKSNGRKMSEL